jgi:hypothetical protein
MPFSSFVHLDLAYRGAAIGGVVADPSADEAGRREDRLAVADRLPNLYDMRHERMFA